MPSKQVRQNFLEISFYMKSISGLKTLKTVTQILREIKVGESGDNFCVIANEN